MKKSSFNIRSSDFCLKFLGWKETQSPKVTQTKDLCIWTLTLILCIGWSTKKLDKKNRCWIERPKLLLYFQRTSLCSAVIHSLNLVVNWFIHPGTIINYSVLALSSEMNATFSFNLKIWSYFNVDNGYKVWFCYLVACFFSCAGFSGCGIKQWHYMRC